MVDWNELASRKYAIEQQRADAGTTTATAEAALANARAATEPVTADAQAKLLQSQAQHTNVESSLLPGQAASQSALQGAQSALFGVQGDALNASSSPLGYAGAHNYLQSLGLRTSKYGAGGQPVTPYGPQTQAPIGQMNPTNAPDIYGKPTPGVISLYSEGTAKVPGEGDGTVDRHPAVLADGEAVLNKAAAEHLGRGFIAALNAVGAHMMGLNQENGGAGAMGDDAYATNKGGTAEKEPQDKKLGYAKGTADVPFGAGAPPAAKGKGMVKKGGKASAPSKNAPAPAAGPANPQAGALLAAIAGMARQNAGAPQ